MKNRFIGALERPEEALSVTETIVYRVDLHERRCSAKPSSSAPNFAASSMTDRLTEESSLRSSRTIPSVDHLLALAGGEHDGGRVQVLRPQVPEAVELALVFHEAAPPATDLSWPCGGMG